MTDTTDAAVAASPTFKPGDVVQLKSGGPLMTVLQLSDPDDDQPSVETVWFDHGGEAREEWFYVSSLVWRRCPA